MKMLLKNIELLCKLGLRFHLVELWHEHNTVINCTWIIRENWLSISKQLNNVCGYVCYIEYLLDEMQLFDPSSIDSWLNITIKLWVSLYIILLKKNFNLIHNVCYLLQK